jgi:hypothetical protein
VTCEVEPVRYGNATSPVDEAIELVPDGAAVAPKASISPVELAFNDNPSARIDEAERFFATRGYSGHPFAEGMSTDVLRSNLELAANVDEAPLSLLGAIDEAV